MHPYVRGGRGGAASPPLGLTRFSFILMDRRVSLTELHFITDIPKPTLSMYKTGRRPISHGHRPILAIALDVPIAAIVGYVDTEVIVLESPESPDPDPTPEPDDEPSHPPTTP